MPSRGRRVLVLVALVGFGGAVATGASFASSAHRERAPGYGVQIQAVFSAAGNPVLVANFVPNGALATAHWSICPPSAQSTCSVAASRHGALTTGPEPAGTRFVARARYAGRTYSTAVTWQGSVQALSAPGLAGSAREGAVVDPRPAQWTGGWGGEFDQLGIEACATPSGSRCWMLGGGELGCPDNSSRVRLRGWFTGWYLFALDARLARNNACGGTGYRSNVGLPLWNVAPTVVRSSALARITGPPRPTVKFLSPAVLNRGTLYVARVRCLTRCTAGLEVDSTTGGTSRRFAFRGTRRLGVRTANLMPGRVTIVLFVDDSPLLRARSTYP